MREVSAAYIGPPAAPIAPSTVNPEPASKRPGVCTQPTTITSPPPGTTSTSPGRIGMFKYFPDPVSELLLRWSTIGFDCPDAICSAWLAVSSCWSGGFWPGSPGSTALRAPCAPSRCGRIWSRVSCAPAPNPDAFALEFEFEFAAALVDPPALELPASVGAPTIVSLAPASAYCASATPPRPLSGSLAPPLCAFDDAISEASCRGIVALPCPAGMKITW